MISEIRNPLDPPDSSKRFGYAPSYAVNSANGHKIKIPMLHVMGQEGVTISEEDFEYLKIIEELYIAH